MCVKVMVNHSLFFKSPSRSAGKTPNQPSIHSGKSGLFYCGLLPFVSDWTRTRLELVSYCQFASWHRNYGRLWVWVGLWLWNGSVQTIQSISVRSYNSREIDSPGPDWEDEERMKER